MNNFTVLNIAYTPTSTTLSFIITTNNPCHLTCYYTDKEPRRHRTARNQRGLTLPWGVYFCFVAWQSVEQIEPGDTLTHTFEIPDWSFCQTKWFAFRGTVSEVLSPSVSCLFQYHHPGPPALQKFESYEINWDYRFSLFGALCAAQTFTPQQEHTITSVRLLLSRSVWTWPTLYIYIRAAPDDIPIGPVLASGSISAFYLTTLGAGRWVEIPLTAYKLPAYTKYAIIANADTTSAARLFWHVDFTDATYPRGIALQSLDGGATWEKLPTWDLLFQEWGHL
ncbi:hypothetical protein ES708_27124 [subsurface metagenome]